MMTCKICGSDMEHDGRWGWVCSTDECGGSREDVDDYDWDRARDLMEDA